MHNINWVKKGIKLKIQLYCKFVFGDLMVVRSIEGC